MKFRWNDWNLDHAASHGCTAEEIQRVVEEAKPPYPRKVGDEKWLVVGRGAGGRWVQVIYLYDPPRVVYVIHARPLAGREKRRERRRRR